jgi:tetratricopeptide (TPR) repeat protein
LRHLGRGKEALQVLASAAHTTDPLDVRSMAERWLVSKDAGAAKTLASTMNQHPATAQETAAEYLNAGLWQDGIDVLLQMTAAAPKVSAMQPMVYYYLGEFAAKLGQAGKASEYRRLAMAMPPDYVFPFQNEAIDVLRQAIEANPRDARAPYYLGNLLFDGQPEEATRLWAVSASLDPSFAIVHRNLATAYAHRKPAPDIAKAIAELELAVAAGRKYPLHFTELDELYEQAGVPIEKRLPLFEANQDVVAQRDDSQNRAIALKIAMDKYDDAIRMMTGRKFAVAEGANLNVAENWSNAHLLRGQQKLQAGRYPEALADFQTAAITPANLPSAGGRGGSGVAAEMAYWTGVAEAALGDREKAVASWNRAVAPAQAAPGGRGGPRMGGGAQLYYQGLCLQKLGQNDKAKALFQGLVESGRSAPQQSGGAAGGRGGFGRPQAERARLAAAHYTTALGYLGLGEPAKAKAELSQSVELSPDLSGARHALASLQ